MTYDDPIYYRNRSGAVAVSLDDGVTVLLPTNRQITRTEAWDESDKDLHADLTPWQQGRVDEHTQADREGRDWTDFVDGLQGM